MTGRRIVVALGGNAILAKDASAEAQQRALQETARHLVNFVKEGDQLIITHATGHKLVTYYCNKQLAALKPIHQCR